MRLVDPLATRRRAFVLVLGLLLLVGSGCSDDDDVTDPDGDTFSVELHYDAPNDSSPNLAGATYEAAARFTTVQTGGLVGGVLTEVRFYIDTLPTSCRVKIYGANTATAPGALLYTSPDVTAGLVADGWNTHVLTSGVTVPNGDLWISIEFTHAGLQATIGCDPGPAVPDGDWLFSSTDGNWTPFNDRFAVSVNWNIRGIVRITL